MSRLEPWLAIRERAERIVRTTDDLSTEDQVPSEVLAPLYEYAEALIRDAQTQQDMDLIYGPEGPG